MTSPESRAQEGARLREAAILLVSQMIDMRGGTGFAMAERMVPILRDLARTLLELVEKERDEARENEANTKGLLQIESEALTYWHIRAETAERQLSEAREENTRLREQLQWKAAPDCSVNHPYGEDGWRPAVNGHEHRRGGAD